MTRRNTRNAFTLVELLIVVTILGLLWALLSPAIQGAREAGRRSACQNNLRQVGIAIQSFEVARKRYPIGAWSQRNQLSGQVTFGLSWWVDILPQLEETIVYDRLDLTGPNVGWIVLHPQNGLAVDNVELPFMHCPSSPIPRHNSGTGFRVNMPSYVGIAGAFNDGDFAKKRESLCCSPELGGQISARGMLVPNSSILASQATDGASHIMIVGEASDYCFERDGSLWRVDGGFQLGWLAGTSATGTPPNYARTAPSYNITTVRYPINTRDCTLPGVDDNKGANNPLISTHPGGIAAVFLDGSVHFLAEELDVSVLKRYATRDDGEAIPGSR